MRYTLLSADASPFGRFLAVVLVLVSTAGCNQASPLAVDPGSDLVSYSHLPWSGCTLWNGPAFASVTFEKGSAELDDVDRAALDANVERLNLCPEDGFHVVGLAVSEPRPRQLAAARAQVVADYYVGAGAELFPGRMDVSSRVMAGGCDGKRTSVSCAEFRAAQTLPY